MNLYGFASGDPVNFSDPFGLCSRRDGWDNCRTGGALRFWGGRARDSESLAGRVGSRIMQGLALLGEGAIETGISAARGLVGACRPGDAACAQVSVLAAFSGRGANAFEGPVAQRTFVVDSRGNAVAVQAGESLTGSANSRWLQVRSSSGDPTGVRVDDGHPSHADSRARAPHAHVPGVTNADGTPWLPVKQ